MKKALMGLAAVGAIVATIVGVHRARRMAQKMREHCGQMAAQCKQMSAQFGPRAETRA